MASNTVDLLHIRRTAGIASYVRDTHAAVCVCMRPSMFGHVVHIVYNIWQMYVAHNFYIKIYIKIKYKNIHGLYQ